MLSQAPPQQHSQQQQQSQQQQPQQQSQQQQSQQHNQEAAAQHDQDAANDAAGQLTTDAALNLQLADNSSALAEVTGLQDMGEVSSIGDALFSCPCHHLNSWHSIVVGQA